MTYAALTTCEHDARRPEQQSIALAEPSPDSVDRLCSLFTNSHVFLSLTVSHECLNEPLRLRLYPTDHLISYAHIIVVHIPVNDVF